MNITEIIINQYHLQRISIAPIVKYSMIYFLS